VVATELKDLLPERNVELVESTFHAAIPDLATTSFLPVAVGNFTFPLRIINSAGLNFLRRAALGR